MVIVDNTTTSIVGIFSDAIFCRPNVNNLFKLIELGDWRRRASDYASASSGGAIATK